MTGSTTFEARGIPRPQGSLTPWVDRTGRVRASHSGGVESARWRGTVRDAALVAWSELPLIGPVGIRLLFRLPKPDRVEPGYVATPPDVDKLSRAVLDALTGVVYRDDSQVVMLTASKVYAAPRFTQPGVVVHVEDWSEEIASVE